MLGSPGGFGAEMVALQGLSIYPALRINDSLNRHPMASNPRGCRNGR